MCRKFLVILICVFLILVMFSNEVFSKQLKKVKLEILEDDEQGVKYKVTNNDTLPIKWYKVRFIIIYNQRTLIGSSRDGKKPVYRHYEVEQSIYHYGPKKPINPGESIECYMEYPPINAEEFWLSKKSSRIICKSEVEEFTIKDLKKEEQEIQHMEFNPLSAIIFGILIILVLCLKS
ncbi:hypothetical protein KAU33_03695 [Candidatus Dependentiae bacterium]|nr:hypothetical protein [Candidatus Dependentiae bacterium]